MNLPLLAASLFALALPAAAQEELPKWAQDAVAGWSEDVRPAEEWDWIKFVDEEGVDRTLFCKKTPDKYNSFLIKDGCQLYSFPSPYPATTPRVMNSTWYHGTEEMTVDVLVIGQDEDHQARISPYYVLSYSGGSGFVGRRDRPETKIPIPFNAHSYYTDAFPWPPTQWSKLGKDRDSERKKVLAVNGVIPWGRIQVFKPKKLGLAATGPLTQLQLYANCRDVDRALSAEPWDQVAKGWTSFEKELWQGDLHPSVKTPGLWTAQHTLAVEQAKVGQYATAAAFMAWYRDLARKAAEELGKASSAASLPGDRFTPSESAQLVCRARHMGKEEDFLAQTGALHTQPRQKQAAFVALWRQYLLRELEQYLKDSATIPPLPRVPDASIDAGMHARFEQALAGKVEGVNAARAQGAPKPKRGGGSARKVEHLKESDVLGM